MPHTRTVALALALAACGGGDKKTPTPDAPMQQDAAMPDAPSCTALTAGTFDVSSYTADQFEAFNAPGGDPGDGHALTLSLEVYGGIEDSLMGTFDLSQGNQANYATCAVCVRAYSQDADGNLVKEFFQKSGSVTISADPLADGHLVASFANVELQEVTIDRDGGTFMSTPVAGGQCTTYGASFNIDHDKVPNAWTCAHTTYQDGNCDCMCGMLDADCDGTSTQTVNGCTAAQPVCSSGTCAAVVANDTCTSAATLTLGTAVQGTTVGAYANITNGLDADTCTGFAQAGADVAYTVHLTAGTQYTVTLSGLDATFDASVYLLGPGAATVCDADPITTCVAGHDMGAEGADETFTYTPATTGDYFVLVDSYYATETGAFTLKVE
jgi:hypothetical protein